jgi:FixJ family two-component response regulator
MTHMETQIKGCLISLLDAIKTSNGEVVVTEMEKLDVFLAEGRGSLHPQLIHFLGKRSYAKAVIFLGGESDIPVGICGGRAGQPSQ